MTNVIAWVERELGILKSDVEAIGPSVVAWAHNFLADLKPVVIKATNDAVLAAITVPGSGQARFAAAVATAGADLVSQGVPIAENDLKAAVQIAYNALPDSAKASAAAQAVQGAADAAIDHGVAEIEKKAAQ